MKEGLKMIEFATGGIVTMFIIRLCEYLDGLVQPPTIFSLWALGLTAICDCVLMFIKYWREYREKY